MEGIKHIFFDLDHTLWDFDLNAELTLIELFREYDLAARLNCEPEEFIAQYFLINYRLWSLFDHGQISKEELREKRFNDAFQFFGYTDTSLAAEIDKKYIARCPLQGNLMTGAIEVLDYLNVKYHLHIITNGFKDIQLIKLKYSKIINYFKTVTTGECTAAKKPNQLIFNHALIGASAIVNESVYIGDNPLTDVVGANSLGMRCILYNSRSLEVPKHVLPDYQVNELKELLKIF